MIRIRRQKGKSSLRLLGSINLTKKKKKTVFETYRVFSVGPASDLQEGFSVAVFTLIGEGQRIQFLFPNRNRSGGSWLCHLRRAGDRKSLDLMLQQNGEEGAALFGSLLQRPNPKG